MRFVQIVKFDMTDPKGKTNIAIYVATSQLGIFEITDYSTLVRSMLENKILAEVRKFSSRNKMADV